MADSGFAAKHVYPSEQGLHIVHYTKQEAEAAYIDAKNRGINNVELDGLILTWKLYNPKSPHPIPVRQGRKQRISRGKSRRLRFQRLPGAILGRRIARFGSIGFPTKLWKTR